MKTIFLALAGLILFAVPMGAKEIDIPERRAHVDSTLAWCASINTTGLDDATKFRVETRCLRAERNKNPPERKQAERIYRIPDYRPSGSFWTICLTTKTIVTCQASWP